MLWSWEGKRVRVSFSNRKREISSAEGVLSDQSSGERIEFGIDEPDSEAATVPVSLSAPYLCSVEEAVVSITMASGMVVAFCLLEPEVAPK